MTKTGTKTVTVALADDEYAALLRLAADQGLRPNQAMAQLLRDRIKRGASR